MNRSRQYDPHCAQAGGITIMVALMLLVLLTIAAVGMSRNSFKEIVATGFLRQGAMARNVADSGAEWVIHWITIQNASAATGAGLELRTLKEKLLADESLSGVAKDLKTGNTYAPGSAPEGDLTLASPSGYTQGFTIGLTRMGKLPLTDMSQGSGPGAFAPATGALPKQAPDLWAVRSDAQVIQSGTTFIHAKEVWVSTPIQ